MTSWSLKKNMHWAIYIFSLTKFLSDKENSPFNFLFKIFVMPSSKYRLPRDSIGLKSFELKTRGYISMYIIHPPTPPHSKSPSANFLPNLYGPRLNNNLRGVQRPPWFIALHNLFDFVRSSSLVFALISFTIWHTITAKKMKRVRSIFNKLP